MTDDHAETITRLLTEISTELGAAQKAHARIERFLGEILVRISTVLAIVERAA